MSTLDIVLLSIIIVFTLVNALWGIVNVVIAVGGVFLGVIVGGALSDPLSKMLVFINDPTVAKGVAFILIVLLFGIAAHVIAFLLGFLPLFGLLNHALGAVLGLAQGLLISAVVLIGAVMLFPDWTQSQLANSVIASKAIGPVSDAALAFAPTPLKDVVKTAVQLYQ